MLMPWGSKVALEEEAPRTYLHRASSLEWDSVLGVVLKSSPSEAVSTERDGYNLLERYAYHRVKQRLAQTLDKLPYDVFDTTPDRGSRILILCAQQVWERIVHLLVHKYSTDDNATDVAGRTIAHWASQLQWQSLLALIASKGRPWINKAGHDGRTALHPAAEHRNETACEALLQAGADSLLRDKAGVAAEQGHRAIVSLLLLAPIQDLGHMIRTRTAGVSCITS
ncbi:ankyrin repeat-containing domain protein [Coniochaeta sp. 2T2.1]|nr:ankyrin repeat-containing domain protein [Coniochaeta sp. 2T2.1]